MGQRDSRRLSQHVTCMLKNKHGPNVHSFRIFFYHYRQCNVSIINQYISSFFYVGLFDPCPLCWIMFQEKHTLMFIVLGVLGSISTRTQEGFCSYNGCADPQYFTLSLPPIKQTLPSLSALFVWWETGLAAGGQRWHILLFNSFSLYFSLITLESAAGAQLSELCWGHWLP